jgi:hypothetical protein
MFAREQSPGRPAPGLSGGVPVLWLDEQVTAGYVERYGKVSHSARVIAKLQCEPAPMSLAGEPNDGPPPRRHRTAPGIRHPTTRPATLACAKPSDCSAPPSGAPHGVGVIQFNDRPGRHLELLVDHMRRVAAAWDAHPRPIACKGAP